MRAVYPLVAALLLAAGTAGCLRTTEFKCMTDADCSASGAVCETTQYCSFTDTECAMGRRYGEFSGMYSNQCVGETSMNDGGVDTPDGTPGGCPGSLVEAISRRGVRSAKRTPGRPTNRSNHASGPRSSSRRPFATLVPISHAVIGETNAAFTD